MNNSKPIIYWLTTAIMCLLFLFSAGMYLTNYEMVCGFFKNLGFPTWLIYPLAILKILAVLAILSKMSLFLKELAYAGLFFDAILALSAHLKVNDGGHTMASIAFVTVCISWFYDKKLF